MEDRIALSGRKNIEASFEIKEILVKVYQNTSNTELLLAAVTFI